MTLRRRLFVELLVVALLTMAFLWHFPERPTYADVLLALVALSIIRCNRGFTRDVVWAQFPAGDDRRTRRRRASLGAAMVSVPLLLVFAGIGAAAGYSGAGWPGVWDRLGNWHLLIALALYLPWALLQQYLFQFYLLGRLLSLMPAAGAVVLTGLAYSLVHLPDPGITAATAFAGVFWSALYQRYRLLAPLAVSHALLGTCFYYWAYDRDLFTQWTEAAYQF